MPLLLRLYSNMGKRHTIDLSATIFVTLSVHINTEMYTKLPLDLETPSVKC